MVPPPSTSSDGAQSTPLSPTSEGKGNKAGDNQQATNENDLDASGSGQVGSEKRKVDNPDSKEASPQHTGVSDKGNGGKPTTNLEETQVHHVG